MLDSVVKLTEKISELIKYRADRRARTFKQLIEPMYVALKEVHRDYLAIFETVKTELIAGRDLCATADSLVARRLTEEAERRAILQQAETLRKDESLADCHPFFEAVVDYFHDTPLSGGRTPSRRLLHELSAAASDHLPLQSRPSDDNSRESLLRAVDRTLERLRNHWESVSTEYARVLAASVE